MTREELHALVWAKPMRTAAAERGISDVALAKQCRRAGVPVPPRGYWNKVHAGKAVVAQSLPPLPPTPLQKAGLGGLFPALKAPPTGVGGTNTKALLRPEFLDLAEAKKRIEAVLGGLDLRRRFAQSHPIVAKLLEQEEKRKTKRRPGEDDAYYELFYINLSKPIQQRRLKFLSKLLNFLGDLGIDAFGSKQEGENFSLEIGASSVSILIGVEDGSHKDPFRHRRRAGVPDKPGIRLDVLEDGRDGRSTVRTWRDGALPIEQQLADILRGILFYAETRARQGAIRGYDWAIADRMRKAEELEAAAGRAREQRIACEAAALKARRDALFGGANDLEQAERIRRYVAAVRERCAQLPETLAPDLLAQWTLWALSEANALDPVLSGRVLRDTKRWVGPVNHPAIDGDGATGQDIHR
ncbi:hypothetical protein EOD42_07605 [Rhodovarius crocodyli]|uniref:Uncharacterized protein n=1 Tax=Rhodovarius crocodyli TaxID=1979269 RepID=A0A437MJ47_9PROT|nr:hypothetical protein [Rhodovarius crocodyli]RVT97672.1 hypothetical protein EOD42_07605 [Rhodovarius crocodyli]